MVFNSMLEHALQGRFDVDPATIGDEGYLRLGRTYAYFGVFGALLRLPLLLVPGGIRLDVTILSCWLAASLAGAAKLHALFWLRRREHGGPVPFIALALALTLAGALAANLQVSIYSEVMFWAYALASFFVVAALQGFVLGRFSTARLTVLAAIAGLCLLARASTGTGLYAALSILLLAAFFRDWRALPKLLLPGGVALLFGLATLGINAGRWGSPFTGQDLDSYLMLREMTNGAGVLARHGMFSLERIPLALQYYFTPIWPLPGPGGTLFATAERDLFFTVELPPSSLLLTDLVSVALAILLLRAALRGRGPGWTPFLVIGALLIPAAVVLCYWALANRYRLEFAPALDLAALLAYASPEIRAALGASRTRVLALALATATSLAATALTLVLYRLAYFADAHALLEPGFKAFYESRYRYLARQLGVNLPFSRQR